MKAKTTCPQTVRDTCDLFVNYLQCFSNDVNDNNADY